MKTEASHSELVVRVHLPVANLPSGPGQRLGLTAVVEAADGRLAYWALRHDCEHPDFHRVASFVLAPDPSGSPSH